MAAGVMDLTTTEFSLEQQASRITALQQSLEAEHVRLQKLLNELNSPALTTPASLTQKTTEYTNATKHITAKRQEYRERISNLASTWSAGQVSIPQVIAAEEEVRRLQKSLREIEGKVQAFHGLPPSRTLALQEIERMGREVERLRQRRDGLFEGLVEDDTEAPRQ
ncbi:MAG: hypothetical protein M1838_005159 [Thelocarpon superellum]|nr:MAG: hypothetical protein M1838_005159 [Thelocarpon superellum]